LGISSFVISISRARALRKAGYFDYHVCIHPRRNLEDFIVYPILLHQQLPEIDIPLLGDDGPVKVDLQAVFERCYEAGAYHRQIRYREETPDPPLPSEQAQWAEELVERKGIKELRD
jgi:hypothetical protein